MAKGKHISRATPRATVEIINRKNGGPRGMQQKHEHAIVLKLAKRDRPNVKQIFVRFGTKRPDGNYNWDTTVAMGPVNINPRQQTTVAMFDSDQLPAGPDRCYCTVLCEILTKNKHKQEHIETLMTPVTKVMSAEKL